MPELRQRVELDRKRSKRAPRDDDQFSKMRFLQIFVTWAGRNLFLVLLKRHRRAAGERTVAYAINRLFAKNLNIFVILDGGESVAIRELIRSFYDTVS